MRRGDDGCGVNLEMVQSVSSSSLLAFGDLLAKRLPIPLTSVRSVLDLKYRLSHALVPPVPPSVLLLFRFFFNVDHF